MFNLSAGVRWMLLTFEPSVLSWATFRTKVIGATDPKLVRHCLSPPSHRPCTAFHRPFTVFSLPTRPNPARSAACCWPGGSRSVCLVSHLALRTCGSSSRALPPLPALPPVLASPPGQPCPPVPRGAEHLAEDGVGGESPLTLLGESLLLQHSVVRGCLPPNTGKKVLRQRDRET